MKFVGVGANDIVFTSVTTAITGGVASVAAGGSGTWDATGCNTALLQFTWGTGGSLQFQGSVDGTTNNWVKINLWAEGDNVTSETSASSVSASGTYRAAISGYQHFRLIVLTTGSVNGTVSLALSTSEFGPVASVNTVVMDGGNTTNRATVTAGNALKVDGSAVPQPVTSAVITGATGNITASGNTNGLSVAVGNAGSATISVHGTYNAILNFEMSDDTGTTWYKALGVRLDGTGAENITGTLVNSAQMWQFGLGGVTNIRVWASTYTSGTVNAKISFSGAMADPAIYVSGGTVSVNALPNGSNTIGKVTSTNDSTTTTAYSATATTVIKASAGRLVSLLVTTAGTVDVPIYDNASAASGTIIGMVPAAATKGQVIVCAAPAANGITVGGLAGNAAFTVFWA